MTVGDSSILERWRSLCRFALARAASRVRTAPRQTAALVGVVALTIALLVIVTGIGVALAEDPSAEGDADLRVTPADGGTLSAVVDVEGPRLGTVHDRTAPIDARDDVDYATPVLVEVVQIRGPASDEPVTVVAFGIVPNDPAPTVAGVPTDALEPGDPHYADGSYDGPRTGDVVLSEAAADQLGAAEDDPLTVRSPQTGAISQAHDVTAVEDPQLEDVPADHPVVVFRLSELQALSGADDGGLADQVLVATDSSAAEGALEEAYPNATVESTDDEAASVRDDDLALATSLVAFVVGLSICSLFVATAGALSVERDRRTLAVLAAVGFSGRARLGVVGLTTMAFVLAGGVLGLVVGIAGIAITNAVATATVAPGAIATVRPAFVPYGLGVALVAGLLALPYPLALASRTDPIDELGR